ncbi:GtrA family protein [Cumulibacter manganitolerans]|uniref:GtrA family protein n=1 Tax=Cumulibacter manganitolerans TaxID=1884992 RepID=UPI001885C593|nr:GtrA family protein [Cumulibacter manganitolerans]
MPTDFDAVTRSRYPQLRLGARAREITAFGVIGALNLVLNIALFTLLGAVTPMSPGWASFTSAAATTVLSFTLNRRYAFGASNQPGARAFVLFVLVNLAGIGIEGGLVAGAAGVFDIRNALPLDAVKTAAIGLGTVFRYVAYRYLVFPAPDRQPSTPVLATQRLLSRWLAPRYRQDSGA